MQAFYMDYYGLVDIPWNFMIGGDGRIYEGRGFKFNGEIARNRSKFSSFDGIGIHIAIIGTYDSIPEVTRVFLIRTFEDFLDNVLKREMLVDGYKLFLEDQLTLAASLGSFYNALQEFDRFYPSNFYFFQHNLHD